MGEVTVQVSVMVPLAPSVTDGLLIVKVSLSSLVIVPVPVAPVVMAAAWVAVVLNNAPTTEIYSLSLQDALPILMFTLIVCVSPATPANVSGLLVVTL